MNAKHTPGPWEAVIYGGFDAPRVFGCGGSVALLQHHASGPQEAEANARLIAAAPDLLDVLQEIVHLANEIHDHWDNDRDMKVGKYLLALSGNLRGYDKRTDELHDTIAKAIGGESCQQPS